LASDLDAFLPVLTALGGKTYADLLQQLQTSADRALSNRSV
jgi:hypothetical protein